MGVELIDANFFMNLAGLIVGIVGVGLAVRSHSKLRTARQAVKAAERKLFCHMAAEDFGEIARQASEVIPLLGRRDWNSLTKLSTEISRSLGDAKGRWEYMLKPLDRDQLDAATENIQDFSIAVPGLMQHEEIVELEIRAIISTWQTVLSVSSYLSGRLRRQYLQDSGEMQ
jgi:hypothetical protein